MLPSFCERKPMNNLILPVDTDELSKALMKSIVNEFIQSMPPRKELSHALAPVLKDALEASLPIVTEVTREAIQEAFNDPQFREQYKTTVKNVLARKLGGEVASNLIAASAREAAKAIGLRHPLRKEMIELGDNNFEPT